LAYARSDLDLETRTRSEDSEFSVPNPGEHKTVQACILYYAQEIGRTFMPREEADRWRSVDANGKPASLYFDDLL